MRIHVSTSSGVPIYLQIKQQIKQMVVSGSLPAGAELPAIRSLAAELVINPNTVARAYRDLEQEGILASRQGSGTFVAEAPLMMSRSERERRMDEGLDEIVVLAQQLGYSEIDIVRSLEKRIAVRETKEPNEREELRSPFNGSFID